MEILEEQQKLPKYLGQGCFLLLGIGGDLIFCEK